MRRAKGWLSGESHLSTYEMGVYTFLSLFRFFSFALATALIFTVPRQPVVDWPTLIIALSMGIYTALKILFRHHSLLRGSLTRVVLTVDLLICAGVVLLTGGADSPFLLYSLSPTITAALFFQRTVALAVAVPTALNLVLAHTALSLTGSFPFILDGSYSSLVSLYAMLCVLLATVSYYSNINVYSHIQSQAIVAERRRLRHEIHDGIAQVMGYLKTKTTGMLKSHSASNEELMAALDEINKVTSEGYYDIREAIDALDTEMASLSLDTALRNHIDGLQKRMDCKVEFSMPEKLPALPPPVQLQLLRIGQEALNNVRKHAAATHVWVRLQSTLRGLELVVKDNGAGFSPSESKGAGLKIMAERANSINGTLAVTSSPGQGTEISVKVPKG